MAIITYGAPTAHCGSRGTCEQTLSTNGAPACGWALRLPRCSPSPCVQCPIEEWRARLWQYSLAEHGAGPAAPALGADLQRCFNTQRLAAFQLQPGVQVRAGSCRDCRSSCASQL